MSALVDRWEPIDDANYESGSSIEQIVKTLQLDERHLDDVAQSSMPGVTIVRTSDGAFRSRRAEDISIRPNFRLGAPVTSLPVASEREAAYLMPDPVDSETVPERCQDRIALVYSAENGQRELRSFALGDGVSRGLLSAGTADVFVRYMAAALAEAAHRGVVLEEASALTLCQALGAKLHALNPRKRLLDEYLKKLRTSKLNEDFLPTRDEVERETRDEELGSTTMLAGQVEVLGDGRKRLRLMNVGDSWAAIVEPTGQVSLLNLGSKKRVPDQLCIGTKEQQIGGMTITNVVLPKGAIFIAGSDGLESFIVDSLSDVVAQLRGSGKITANMIAASILMKGAVDKQGKPQSFDDRSIVAIQA